MKRRNLNLAIDAATLLGMLALVFTGVVIHWLLPAGSGGRGGDGRLTLWGAGRHQWGELHFWIAILVVGLLVLHLVVHWSWICATTRGLLGDRSGPSRRLGRRALAVYGVGFAFGLALILGGLFAAGSSAVVVDEGHRCRAGGDRAGLGQGHRHLRGAEQRPGQRGGHGHGRRAARSADPRQHGRHGLDTP